MNFKPIHKLSILVVFTALCLASNYALISLPQVKLMDFLVFTGGFLIGSVYGAAIGIFSWLVYGALNPYGFVPQIWLATMLSESLYGVIGGIIGREFYKEDFGNSYFSLNVFFGVLGFILTFFYDLITNIVYAITFNVPVIVAIFTGAPYTILHQVFNAIVFGVCFLPTVITLQKLMGGVWTGILEK